MLATSIRCTTVFELLHPAAALCTCVHNTTWYDSLLTLQAVSSSSKLLGGGNDFKMFSALPFSLFFRGGGEGGCLGARSKEDSGLRSVSSFWSPPGYPINTRALEAPGAVFCGVCVKFMVSMLENVIPCCTMGQGAVQPTKLPRFVLSDPEHLYRCFRISCTRGKAR